MENYISEIRIFPYKTIPKGWLPCNGQELPLSGYEALAALLGDNYGGDWPNTFALPNLNGRTIVGYGQSARGHNFPLGQAGGTETVALTDAGMIPAHLHTLYGSNVYNVGGANNNYLGNPNVPASNTQSGKNSAQANLYAPAGGTTVTFPGVITSTGSADPHENRMPYLVTNYCIAYLGYWPSRY